MMRRARTAPTLLVPVFMFLAPPAPAQIAAPDALRQAPPEIDRSRPGGDPADPAPDRAPNRSGAGPTGNDILGEREGGGARGVLRPPMGVDPGIQGTVPDPTPNRTPVITPPGMPGGAPGAAPR